jgi:hypothetical protein
MLKWELRTPGRWCWARRYFDRLAIANESMLHSTAASYGIWRFSVPQHRHRWESGYNSYEGRPSRRICDGKKAEVGWLLWLNVAKRSFARIDKSGR